MRPVHFNRAWMTGREVEYLREVLDAEDMHLAGNGPFAARCTSWLEETHRSRRALLTPSCTAALEMCILLADVKPGDEVIMPSFTFVSTANAVVLRGGVPVFVDVRADTLNLDESLVEAAVTDRTRAVFAVHYAGVGCELDELRRIAEAHDLFLLEDAAQGTLSTYRDAPLGSFGHAAAVSFHETKNVTCGEGGALLVNDERWIERAEILQEKGTDRSRFFRGQVDKYSWVDVGSSYVTSELAAAFLWAQLEHAREITERRLALWRLYDEALEPLEESGVLRRPIIPTHTEHNAHMYYVLLLDEPTRARVIEHLAAEQIYAVFHYVPLHASDAGRRFGRMAGSLAVTEDASDRLLRLPLHAGLSAEDVERVATTLAGILAPSGQQAA